MSETINVSEIQEKIKSLREQAELLQNALDYLLGKNDAGTSFSSPTTISNNLTFKETILNIIKEQNTPLRGRQLFILFQSETGKSMEYSTFSAQLSTLVRGKIILKTLLKLTASLPNKYYYGLPNWFLDGGLKDDYYKKIKPD